MVSVLTIKEQQDTSRAARIVGGYDNLIILERRRRYCKKHNLVFDINVEIAKLKERGK